MTKLRCLIIDDEKSSRIILRDLLTGFCSDDVTIAGEASDIEEAYVLIESLKPDLLFLDIQMPTGNGFNLLRKFSQPSFDVIFVTSFDKYAINAVKFSALDYLLKPVDINELIVAVKKATFKFRKKIKSSQLIVNLLNNVTTDQIDRQLALHKGDAVWLIPVSEIHYITSESNYCHVFTQKQGQFTCSKTLKEFEDYFEDYPSMIRIHKSCIINIRFISNYSKGDPCVVTMNNGMNFEISRRKKQEVLKYLHKQLTVTKT